MSEGAESIEVKPIRSRTAARQLVFQCVYALDTEGIDLEAVEANLAEQFLLENGLDSYVLPALRGISEKREELDEAIAPHLAKGWSLARIAKTDRAILRVAAYELWHCPGISPKVTLNEAVNLARVYGSEESRRFVNGLLGSLLNVSPKAQWDPSQEEVWSGPSEESVTKPELEEVTVTEGTDEYDAMMSAGAWVVKLEPKQ